MLPPRATWLVVALVAQALGCSGARSAETGALVPPAAAPATAVPAPSGPMPRAEAERYALALINRDRAAAGLPSVTWDETAAEAGRRQARDMATHGFTAHLGTDGSVPEQRYTEAGGRGMVMENAGCFSDAQPRVLDEGAMFTAARLEDYERRFIDEVPPNDGHRRNILTRVHSAVGVGLVQPVGLDVPCLAQEFVDDYGRYEEVPRAARLGAKLHVEGELRAPATVAGVGLARLGNPRRQEPAALNLTHGYVIPAPYVSYFPHGFVTPIELQLDARRGTFRIDVPLSDGGKAGRYEVSVWATFPGSAELVMVSLRTVQVD